MNLESDIRSISYVEANAAEQAARMHGRAGAEGTDQPAFGVGTADTRHALEIVAAGAKPLAELLDALKAVPAVGVGVLLIVLCAEVVKVPVEYGMQLIATTGNVVIPRYGLDRDSRAHIDLYW